MTSTSSAAQWGVSLAGLSTTVLPLISAAVIFQHGIAIGKFQGVMIAGDADRLADAHRPLVGQLAGHRVAEHPPALAGHQVRRCRCPPGHRRAPRRGPCPSRASSHAPGAPCSPRAARRTHTGSRRAWARALLRQAGSASSAARMAAATSAALLAREMTDQVARVSRIARLECLAGFRLAPLAADEIAERGSVDRCRHRPGFSHSR